MWVALGGRYIPLDLVLFETAGIEISTFLLFTRTTRTGTIAFWRWWKRLGTQDKIVVEIVVDMVVTIGKDEFCQKRAKYFWDFIPLKTNSSPLKNSAWKMKFLFGGARPIFSGQLLISGRIGGAFGVDWCYLLLNVEELGTFPTWMSWSANVSPKNLWK